MAVVLQLPLLTIASFELVSFVATTASLFEEQFLIRTDLKLIGALPCVQSQCLCTRSLLVGLKLSLLKKKNLNYFSYVYYCLNDSAAFLF